MNKTIPFLLLLASAGASAQDRFANVQIETFPVSDHVYMLKGAGGNIGVSTGDDGLLMIDDQFAPLSDKIKAAMRELGGDSPRFLINTHYHGDHTGGNLNFEGSTIVSHDNVRPRLINGETGGDFPPHALPVLTYQSEATVHFNGDTVKLIHMGPGHTDGDTVVHFVNANVVHMGDKFFRDRFPYVDIDAGGSVPGLIENIAATIKMIDEDTQVIPGHGALARRGDLKRYLGMLRDTSNRVKKAVEKGKGLGEIIEKGLPKKYDSWGTGFINEERWLTTLYRTHSN